jgi:hypothetical protein
MLPNTGSEGEDMSDLTGTKKETGESFAQFVIRFPRAKKTPKTAEALFKKLVNLLHEEKRSLHVKLQPDAEARRIVLDSDQFNFAISVMKTPSMRILVNNPRKTIKLVNDVGNKLLSYLSTLLGEGAKGSKVMSMVTVIRPGMGTGITRKVLGDARIARLSEIAGQKLNPMGIGLEYESRDREFAIFIFSGKPGLEMILSKGGYRGEIPFNFLHQEYEHLTSPATVIKKLTTAEL